MGALLGVLAVVAVITLVGAAIVTSFLLFGAVTVARKIRSAIAERRFLLRSIAEDLVLPGRDGQLSATSDVEAGAHGENRLHKAPKEVPPKNGIVRLDPEDATPQQVMSVARGLMGDPVMSSYACDVSSALEREMVCRDGLRQALGQEFGEGSITWSHFHAPIEDALSQVVMTAAKMTNSMQMFDSTGYLRLSELSSQGQISDVEAERLFVMEHTLEGLGTMRDANLRAIVGLERLYSEIENLPPSHGTNSSEEMFSELRRLSTEVSRY